MPHARLSPLKFLAPIRVTGPDARTFLQGQLSNDLELLKTGICQLASLNSPQGRVQAVLTLIPLGNDILLLLPRTMLDGCLARLRKYVMRSKVSLSECNSDLVVRAAGREALAAAGFPCPAQPGQLLQHDSTTVLRWHEPGREVAERYLLLGPESPPPLHNHPDDTEAAWRLAEIRAGLPQVLPETHESFVAQMLNLDLVGGISFSKGCYTGQEIIARTQYRGAIKRRMLRFGALCPPPLPGTRLLQGQVHAGDVVDAVATPEGCELLAVVSLAQKDAALELASAPGVRLAPLSLPYDLGA